MIVRVIVWCSNYYVIIVKIILRNKWKDRYGGNLDSGMMCNRLEEAHLSGKKDCAMSCHPGMGKAYCLSDKALPGCRSFSMIWKREEVKRRKEFKLAQSGSNNCHRNFISCRIRKSGAPN